MRRTATAALQTRAPESRVIFAPRSYQRGLLEAMRAGKRKIVTVWHRRGGKDVTWVAGTLEAMLRRQGNYFHVYTTLAEGRDKLWNAQADGRRLIDIIPAEIVVHRNETEMQLTLMNGSIWQIMAAEDFDKLRGLNPYGVVLSEYSEITAGDEVWKVLRPVFAENGGWIGFNFTPKGRNHAYRVWQMARERVLAGDPTWYVDLHTVATTRRDGLTDGARTGEPVIAEAEIDADRRDGVPWEPTVQCVTAWDLGYDDATAIWVVQAVGRELRVLDYLEAQGEFVPYFAKQLKTLEYVYGEHLLPHDAAAENIRAEQTIEGQLRALGIRPTRIVPKAPVETGIQAVRALFPRLVFDAARCRLGLERLAAYRKRKDQQTQEYRGAPVHDVASDAADALRTLAMGLRRSEERRVGEEG